MNILFKETQRFNRGLSSLILFPVLSVFILIGIKQFTTEKYDSLANVLIALVLVGLVLAIVIILTAKLETTITKEGIHIRFFPILLSERFITWTEINESYVREYNAINEFSGWGIPFINSGMSGKGLGKNKALNTTGNAGLQLILKNGDKLLIGSQKPNDLALILNQNSLIVQIH